MAGTVVGLNMTTVSLCDAVGSWSGSPSPTLNDPALFGQREGNYCLQSYAASGTARSADWTYGTNQDLTNKIIYMWFATSRITGLPVKGIDGMRIRIEDVSTNWAEWDIFGADTLPHGGWICWAVEANSATASRNGGTFPTLTQIRKIGWRCGGTVLGKTYIYWDAVRFGQGLQIYGDAGTFDDFATSEIANAWGVVNKYKGVYFVQGKLYFGSTSLGQATNFEDLGKTLVFQNNLVTSAFYEMKTLTNANADTEIYFGESPGISGCIFGLELPTQTAKYIIDFTPTQRTKIGLYGCTFKRAGTISLPVYDASYTREVLNSSFEGCGEIIPQNCVMEGCNFINAPGNACRIALVAHKVKYCNFISCVYCIHINISDELDFYGLKFSGTDGESKYDIHHSIAGTLTVNLKDLSNAQYVYEGAGGNTNLVSPVVLTLKGLPDNTEVTIAKVSDRTVLKNVPNSSGDVVYNYGSAEIGLVVDILCVHLDYDPNLGQIFDYTLGSENATIPISLVPDPTYLNP